MKEEWKSVPGYEIYEVSNLSRVRKKGKGNKQTRIITPTYWEKAPYLMFSTCINGKVSKMYLHRAVALAWVPNPNPAEFNAVCFKDLNKYNVSVENLYWSNQTQRMKRRQTEGGYLGMDGARKLSEEDVREIREIWSHRGQPGTMNQQQMAKHFGVHSWTIWTICNYKTWKHVK